MLTYIIGLIALVVIAVLGLAASRPSTFNVTRRISVNAPPQQPFDLVNDFRQWPKWSPWEDKDPAMARTLSGAASGKGAVYAWSGDKKVGQGRMEITSVEAAKRIDIDLQFIAPWKAHNATVFSFAPASGGTDVTWTMTGASPFMFKLMGLFMNMDAMIGADFEKGLVKLKTAAEG